MPLHLIKVCVGVEAIEELAHWQARRRKGGKTAVYHYTRHMPKRADEILTGGSLYWIIKGAIQVRQRILGFETVYLEDEGRHCGIRLDRKLVPVVPRGRGPHQGWRYLEDKDAPPDLKLGRKSGTAQLPPELIAELRSLGLL